MFNIIMVGICYYSVFVLSFVYSIIGIIEGRLSVIFWVVLAIVLFVADFSYTNIEGTSGIRIHHLIPKLIKERG